MKPIDIEDDFGSNIKRYINQADDAFNGIKTELTSEPKELLFEFKSSSNYESNEIDTWLDEIILTDETVLTKAKIDL